jgi:cytidylate kinase
VSAFAEVREALVRRQRELIADAVAESGGIVVEGRDIGSVVLPDAPVKIYLVADPAARAARRAAELGGIDATATQADLARRDEIDSTRAASPLAKASDAIEIDGTHMTLDQVVGTIVALVHDVTRAGAP